MRRPVSCSLRVLFASEAFFRLCLFIELTAWPMIDARLFVTFDGGAIGTLAARQRIGAAGIADSGNKYYGLFVDIGYGCCGLLVGCSIAG